MDYVTSVLLNNVCNCNRRKPKKPACVTFRVCVQKQNLQQNNDNSASRR